MTRTASAAALAGLGIPTLVLPSADTLDDVYGQIEVLGDATGHADEADAVVDGMRTDIDGTVADLPEPRRSR